MYLDRMKKTGRKNWGWGGARRGAGRPATGNDPVVSHRMPRELIEHVEAWADAHKISRSDAIRRLIESGLSRGK
jgi:hypothetical protein